MFLVINDLDDNFQPQLKSLLPNNTNIFSKTLNPLKGCLGCFSCWTKTPGLCIIKDSSQDMNLSMIQCDVFLIISKINYGCYSPYIKNVLDRGIPTLLPFFKKINNEVHHAPRYDKYPKIIAIGYGDDISLEEESTFKKLIKANAINLQSGECDIHIIKDLKDLNTIIPKIVGGKINE